MITKTDSLQYFHRIKHRCHGNVYCKSKMPIKKINSFSPFLIEEEIHQDREDDNNELDEEIH